MKTLMKRLWNEDEAANAVEYGLIAAIIAVGLIAALGIFRDKIVRLFTRTGNQVNSAGR